MNNIEMILKSRLSNNGDVAWSVDVGRNVELFDGNIPLLGGFDREHFREDVYLLYAAKNNPDKLISLLHEFNNIYIWPALAISMITFPDTQDTTKFVVHKSTSKKAVPTRIDNSEKVWDMTSKASVPNWMLSLPNLSFLNFNFSHISYWKNDIYERIFSKNLPWKEFVHLIMGEVLFDTEQDPVLDFSKIFRTEFNGKDPISGAIMAPVYNNAHELKAIIYIAYPRRNVMEGITLFDYKCVLDMQFLLKIVSLCFD